MARAVQVEEVDNRVLKIQLFPAADDCAPRFTYHRRRKRTVQPPTPLADEFRSRLRDIGLRLARLDVRQSPLVVLLGNELETEDTILSQEHVLREDVHAVDTLGPEAVRQRVVSVEVLLERPAEDGAVAVRRERTWQHGDVTETALEGLVCFRGCQRT